MTTRGSHTGSLSIPIRAAGDKVGALTEDILDLGLPTPHLLPLDFLVDMRKDPLHLAPGHVDVVMDVWSGAIGCDRASRIAGRHCYSISSTGKGFVALRLIERSAIRLPGVLQLHMRVGL